MDRSVPLAEDVRVSSLTPDAPEQVETAAIPAQRRPSRLEAVQPIDLTDRGVLLRSWLHTLHGPSIDPRPRTTGHLPALRQLLPTAVAWHVAYVVMSLCGALVVQRSGSQSLVAEELAAAGRPGLVIATLVLWWGGTATASVLWFAAVVSARQRA
jgi:hypothetical protein